MDDVAAYYALDLDTLSLGLLEFVRTLDVLGWVLPNPPATVLDIGGGAGVHGAPAGRHAQPHRPGTR